MGAKGSKRYPVPTVKHRALLKAARANPLATHKEWADAAGINVSTVENWFSKNDEFRQWFGREIMGRAHTRAPMLLEKIMMTALADDAKQQEIDRAVRVMERLDWCGMRPQLAEKTVGEGGFVLNVNLTAKEEPREIEAHVVPKELPEPADG